MADNINSPLSSDNMAAASGVKTKVANYHRLFIGAMIILALSTVSTTIGAYLYCYIVNLHKHPKNAPIFIVWLVIACALMYVSANMAYNCYRNLPVKTKRDDVENGTPLQIFRRNKKPQVVEQRFTISSPKQPRGPMRTDPFKFGDPNPLNSSPVTNSCTNLIEKPSPARLSRRYGVAY